MQVTLIAHASVVVRAGGLQVWTDPWLFGTAFNASWALHPPACRQALDLGAITHLWLSHEHPDHFHIPTLKNLPAAFKRRVEVLFQRNNSDKMFVALRRLGFERMTALPHRRKVALGRGTTVYCYQQGQINSALALMVDGRAVLNVNDAELGAADCRLIRRDIGAPEVVLNQYSVAGYAGQADHRRRLPRQAQAVLAAVMANHRDLGAKVTIPFASLMYFSHCDNRYINAFANTPADVVRAGRDHGADVAVLYPGDTYTVGQPHDSRAALAAYARAQAQVTELPYTRAPEVDLATIVEAGQRRSAALRARFPGAVLRLLRPVVAEIEDLGITLQLSLATGFCRAVTGLSPTVSLKSQALDFCLRHPYGLQTLGVSGRYVVHRDAANWRRLRILCALDNAEISLRPRELVRRRMVRYGRDRLQGAWQQLGYALARLA